MVDKDEFVPDHLEVQDHTDGERVRLVFGRDSDGATKSIVLKKDQLPAIASQLHRRIEAGSVVPISPSDMRIGADYRLTGYEVGIRSDSFRLNLHVELPAQGRTVTMGLDLNKKEAADLRNWLGRWLERS
jgi:hypothetical protein